MEKSITSTITNYLKCKYTDYALLINGIWGCGKTYYIKNSLKQIIEETDVPNETNSSKYKLVYISLYGVSSKDEIDERVLYAIFPKLKMAKWARSLVHKIIDYLGFGASCLTKKEETELNEFIVKKNNKDKVFIFDDLERINNQQINIKTVLGHINYMSEHENCKIVIVANDEFLGEDYKEFKEKSIRFSLKFSPNLCKVFDEISQKYSQESKYASFLNREKEEILNIFKAGNCENLRTLIFALDVFKRIYDDINSLKENKYKEKIMSDLLIPFIIVTIEIKKGHTKEQIQTSLRHILPPFKQYINTISMDIGIPDLRDKEQKQYIEELRKQYKEFSDRIILSQELFDLVYDGYASFKQRAAELQENYCRREQSMEEKLADRIIKWKDIPEDEFDIVIGKVKENVKNLKYDNPYLLLNIYFSLISIEEYNSTYMLTEKDSISFKNAISKALENKRYDNHFNTNTNYEDYLSEQKKKFQELREFAIKINNKNLDTTKGKKKEEVLNCIKSNNVENFKIFMNNLENREYFDNPEEIIKAVINSNIEIKKTFKDGLAFLFPINAGEPTTQDINRLVNTKNILMQELSTINEKKQSLAYLYDAITEIEQTINEYQFHKNGFT